MNLPDCTVVWLSDGQRCFPHVVFAADTDAVAAELASFTSINGNEVVIGKLTAEEFNAGSAGLAAATARVNKELARNDLCYISLVRVESPSAQAGSSFQEFRHQWQPTLIYSALNGRGEALVVREQSQEEFKSHGGLVTKHDA
jgi:hypothetical protein